MSGGRKELCGNHPAHPFQVSGFRFRVASQKPLRRADGVFMMEEPAAQIPLLFYVVKEESDPETEAKHQIKLTFHDVKEKSDPETEAEHQIPLTFCDVVVKEESDPETVTEHLIPLPFHDVVKEESDPETEAKHQIPLPFHDVVKEESDHETEAKHWILLPFHDDVVVKEESDSETEAKHQILLPFHNVVKEESDSETEPKYQIPLPFHDVVVKEESDPETEAKHQIPLPFQDVVKEESDPETEAKHQLHWSTLIATNEGVTATDRDITWQQAPGPPAKKQKTSAAESLVWPFFLVPEGSNKKTAKIVKCIKCNIQVSRGGPSCVNQTRGTSNMLRHLCSYHWDKMPRHFQDHYRNSSARSLSALPQDPALSSGSPVVTSSSTSTGPTLTVATSDSSVLLSVPSSLTRLPSLHFQLQKYIILCRDCGNTFLMGTTPFEQWKDVLCAHDQSCVPC